MDDSMRRHFDTQGENAAAALLKNGFAAQYFQDRQDALRHLLALTPDGSDVGIGGSVTLGELAIREALSAKRCRIHDHNAPGLSPEERLAVRRRQLVCDVFLCSSNAITLDGELVNIDGTGNRVAAMMFGPGKVIVAAGVNKIVKDLAAADRRLKEVACPANNKRLNLPNPCVKTGECMDCRSERRICNLTTVISRRPPLTDMHVCIIGEALGY